MTVTLDSRVKIAPEILYQRVRHEMVILDLVGERYYSLNEVGSRIWDLLAEEHTIAQIAEVIAVEFEAAPARVQDDVRVCVDDLVKAGLAVVTQQ